MVKKRDINEALTVAEEIVISASDASEDQTTNCETSYERLLASAEQIRKNEDILGYILRGESKATVNLDESAKIAEYALLSSQFFESSETTAETLGLGEIQNSLAEGKTMKILCFTLGENLLSIFVKKSAAHDWLLERFSTPKFE